MKRIYLDHAASTPVDPQVLAAMQPYFSEKFGNPGSLHTFGQETIAAVDASRETIAKAVGAEFRQIIFTGSATEANGLALRGAVSGALHGTGYGGMTAKGGMRPRIIISATEHESILETAREAERIGVEVIYLPTDRDGIVDVKAIKENLNERTVLVSIMYANNEIGAVQPVVEIAGIIKDFREGKKEGGKKEARYPLFHTDAVQAFQFFDCDVKKLGVDLMTLSAHKIYGPKGIGALYIRDLKDIRPIISGGGQEFGLRSGTENVPAMVGFAKAVELAVEGRMAESKRIGVLRKYFWSEIKKIVPKAEINGTEEKNKTLPNILNIYFPDHEAQDLLTKFDLKGLAVSSGSACRSRALESSYVIQALGYGKVRAKSSIRFSFGRPTTESDVQGALEIIKSAL